VTGHLDSLTKEAARQEG